MHRLQELVRLHRLHMPVRSVARHLSMSPNTERAYRVILKSAGLMEGPVDALPSLEALKEAVLTLKPHPTLPLRQQVSKVSGYQERIRTYMQKGMRAQAIYDRLRLEEPLFPGSLSSVKRMVRSMQRAQGVDAKDVAIPVETGPGEVAQVDFGVVGKLYDPKAHTFRKAYCFVMVLGYSRHMVVRVGFDQKISSWLHYHIEAFTALGGVVQTVVPDNLKSAVTRAAFGVVDRAHAFRKINNFDRLRR